MPVPKRRQGQMTYEERREARKQELKAQSTAKFRAAVGLPPPSSGRVKEIMEDKQKGVDHHKLLQVDVPESIHTELKLAAVRAGVPMRELLVPAIKAFLGQTKT